MKKKGKVNLFDILVENLIKEFSKIPNFDLTQTDELGNRIFNIISFRMADIISYKELICRSFIPATHKAIFDAKKDFQNSQHKIYLNIKEVDFKETLYETIRLGYVGLFHKLENYVNDVIKVSDLIFSGLYETKVSVALWAKEQFQFNIKNWRQFYITENINWISNCVKHKDGFPLKEPRPIKFKYLKEDERIKISPEEFKQDCDLLIKFYPSYLQIMFMFAQHKMLFEKPILKVPESDEKRVEIEALINKVLKVINGSDIEE